MPKKPSHLILNSPFEVPGRYWEFERETLNFRIVEGQRKSGYVMATPGAKGFEDPGQFKEIALVNQIRPRVDAWREASWPGVTGMTRRLLEHWYDATTRDGKRFFFCQLEAVETLIWMLEGDPAERVGLMDPRRRRRLGAAVLQDGDGHRQDPGHGDGPGVAVSQQGKRQGQIAGEERSLGVGDSLSV